MKQKEGTDHMIFYGFNPAYSLYFLFGVAVTLFVVYIALWIVYFIMKRKAKKMEGSADHDE